MNNRITAKPEFTFLVLHFGDRRRFLLASASDRLRHEKFVADTIQLLPVIEYRSEHKGHARQPATGSQHRRMHDSTHEAQSCLHTQTQKEHIIPLDPVSLSAKVPVRM